MIRKIPFVLILMIFAGSVFQSGCTLRNMQLFKTSEKKVTLKEGGSIAVIAAYKNPVNIEIARVVTEGLAAKSTLKVWSQDEIKKGLGAESADFVSLDSFRNDESLKIAILKFTDEIKMKKVNTDYFYFVMSDSIQAYRKNFSAKVRIPVVGYMVEYPSRNVIGVTSILWYRKGAMRRDQDDVAQDAINDLSRHIVFSITKRTGHK